MTRVLVLGASGMLGWVVSDYLAKRGFDVLRARRQAQIGSITIDAEDSNSLEDTLARIERLQFVINCTGVKDIARGSIPHLRRALAVNALFPHRLSIAAQRVQARVIHISTDGVFKGRRRPYYEDSPCDAGDVYGLTKRLGEVFAPGFLCVRCSIVGPERDSTAGLLSWFLSHGDHAVLKGYTNHIWNGVSTLQFAQFCEELMEDAAFDRLRRRTPVFHFSPNQPVSKYELLCIFSQAFHRKIKICPVTAPKVVIRIMRSRYEASIDTHSRRRQMSEVVAELSAYTNTLKRIRRRA